MLLSTLLAIGKAWLHHHWLQKYPFMSATDVAAGAHFI